MLYNSSMRYCLVLLLWLLVPSFAACSGGSGKGNRPDKDTTAIDQIGRGDLISETVGTGDAEAKDDLAGVDVRDDSIGDEADVPDVALPKPTLVSEAGFINIEPVTFTIRHSGREKEFTSSEARLWYAFQPANEEPEKKPLAIFFNGGPGSSTSLLFGFNTGRLTVDPLVTGGEARAENPASWTRFANVLYVDARQTGFSYNLMDNVQNKSYRNKEFSTRNFNPLLDGADFVRLLLRFLGNHPELRSNPVLIVGESYGGVRGTVMGYLLLNYSEMEEGTIAYQDVTLAKEIQVHLESVFPEFAGQRVPRKVIASQFGHMVFIQPLLSGMYQSVVAGNMFEMPDSIIRKLAQETGTTYESCADLGPDVGCDAEYNAQVYVSEVAQRDLYNVHEPAGWIDEICKFIDDQLVQPTALAELLGTDPAAIKELYSTQRLRGYRWGDVPQDETTQLLGLGLHQPRPSAAMPYPLQRRLRQQQQRLPIKFDPGLTGLEAVFGQLYDWDQHYVPMHYIVTSAFYLFDSLMMKIDPSQKLYGEMFLYDIAFMKTFITRAGYDVVIYAPAIPEALCMHTDLVSSCLHLTDGDEARPGSIQFTYQPDAFSGGETLPESVLVRFPDYLASGHPVEATEPEAFLSDVEQWYGEE